MSSQLPIDRPRQIICVGLNYREHAKEAGMDIPSSPVLFAKWPSCLIASGEPIVIPEESSSIDYEGELGVVIGSRASDVSVEDALSHVAGYLCVNDVTARDLQAREGQWTRSKSFDTFGPIGPELVPASQVPDPQKLDIRTWVGDTLVQDGNTADMVFSVAELVSFISHGITLEPGDLIATGTPSGIGSTRTPPAFLRPGDEVRIEISGIGTISNPVVASAGHSQDD